MHIEQGPLLERAKIPLGIVTAIAAPATLKISIEGAGGHAGGVLMPDRHDAFLAAAEVALAAEVAARATGALDSVATTGVCHVFPGAVNSIPSRTTLEIDVRDTDLARRDSIIKAIDDACTNAAENRQVQVRQEIINSRLTFPDQDEFLKYFTATMLYEEGAEKLGKTVDEMRAAIGKERNIVLSKEMLAVVAQV